jgi:16S rRNA (adenine1518-N6/adenine1519-N6)-dimethyltransferase
LRPSKSLGQNFLADGNVTKKIVAAAEINGDDLVIEIGAGLGALTSAIAEEAARVVAIELDRRLIPALRENVSEYGNVSVVNADILKTDIQAMAEEATAYSTAGLTVKILGNLPYYITTSIISKLLEEKNPASSMTFMTQKEVALRLCAESGSREGGAITALIRYHCEPKIMFHVSREVFIPKPNVDSTVIRLDMLKEKPVSPISEALFFAVIKAGFGQRRKTLRNALSGLGGLSKEDVGLALGRAGVIADRRAETLSLQEFSAISDAISSMTSGAAE